MAEITLTYYSDVKDAKLQRNVSENIKNELAGFNGKRVIITIKRLKAQRSSQQNKYLHVLFTIFKDELNELGNEFTMQQVKDLCKRKFLFYDLVDKSTGEVLGQDVKQTSALNKMEFADFTENVIRWAADFFHITLPVPGENIELDFDRAAV